MNWHAGLIHIGCCMCYVNGSCSAGASWQFAPLSHVNLAHGGKGWQPKNSISSVRESWGWLLCRNGELLGWVYDGSAMLSPRDVEPLSEPRHLTINFDVNPGEAKGVWSCQWFKGTELTVRITVVIKSQELAIFLVWLVHGKFDICWLWLIRPNTSLSLADSDSGFWFQL